jgi:medium-chain acyl-[acyl-carrier-protein] hydrolase
VNRIPGPAHGEAASRGSPWILRRPCSAPAVRLFCFCYAGGSAAVYLPWQTVLGADAEVCAVQLPGRGSRFVEPFVPDIGYAADAIARAAAPLLDLPCLFFGHSLGALLAYEVAQRLRTLRLPLPRHLILSGAHGPRLRKPESLHLLDDAALRARLERFAGTPSEVLEDADLLALTLPILRADFRLAAEYAYVPRVPLPVYVTVFAGREDEFDDVAQYEDWFKETTLRAELVWFEGGHFFLNSASSQVLERIDSIIRRARDLAPGTHAQPGISTIAGTRHAFARD